MHETAAQAQSAAVLTPWDPASISSVVSAGSTLTPKPTRSSSPTAWLAWRPTSPTCARQPRWAIYKP
jgi:hypothetical protein